MLDFSSYDFLFYSSLQKKKIISDFAYYCIIENYSNPYLLQHPLFLFGISGLQLTLAHYTKWRWTYVL